MEEKKEAEEPPLDPKSNVDPDPLMEVPFEGGPPTPAASAPAPSTPLPSKV
jgi:hypothetical protein